MDENGGDSLANALLDDLDDLSDSSFQEGNEDAWNDDPSQANVEPGTHSALTTNVNGGIEEASNREPKLKFRNYVEDIALQKHLGRIRETRQEEDPSFTQSRRTEQEHDYHLIRDSNMYVSKLLDELNRSHIELCAAFHPRFPELEEILPNPIQYKNAVQRIGNQESDLATATDDLLGSILSSNQIITVSVAASTSNGRKLSEEEMEKVNLITSYIDKIEEIKQELVSFVETRMEGLMPNVCALVGPSTAARLLGLAGGLSELSRIPACNLQVLGQTKHNSTTRAGFSSINARPHRGILAECELVTRCPKDLQAKALKAVAAKTALAARCDFINVDTGRPRTSTAGDRFRQEIETKYHKWIEPDEAPKLKALPKPDLTIKKRRGGRRIRKMKERFEETAMMKQANTRAFGSETGEYGDDAMGITMGLLDSKTVAGAVRKNTEKRKMRVANTKASRKRQAQMSAAASNRNVLESSVVFTPAQGMELVNPDASKKRVADDNKKWFSEDAAFQSALPQK